MIEKLNHALFLPLILLVSINLLFVDIYALGRISQRQETAATDTATQYVAEPIPEPTATPTERISVPAGPPVVPTAASPARHRKHIIGLGQGSWRYNTWTEIPGMETYIDTRDYSGITSVVFETYMSMPYANGQMKVKLVNVTQSHDVWFSEVTHDTSETIRLVRDISLDPGNNLYRVAVMSTLGDLATIANSRIIITSL